MVCELSSLLQKCSSITSLRKAQKLHAFLLTSSTPFSYQSPFLHNNILVMYSRCGSLSNAHQVFDKMPLRNIISYNSLISAYARRSDYSFYAFKLLTQMGYESLRPNRSTFTSLLQLASAVGDWFLGLALQCHTVKYGLLIDAYVQTSLIGLYSCFGDMGSANEVFGSVFAKDDVAWNCIILGNLKNNKVMEVCLTSERK